MLHVLIIHIYFKAKGQTQQHHIYDTQRLQPNIWYLLAVLSFCPCICFLDTQSRNICHCQRYTYLEDGFVFWSGEVGAVENKVEYKIPTEKFNDPRRPASSGIKSTITSSSSMNFCSLKIQLRTFLLSMNLQWEERY